MNLFLLRHASAGLSRPNPLLDVKRPLDKEGKRHCLHLAHVLNALKINFDFIVSSPLKRSLQTAQLVGTETGFEARVNISNALAPASDYEQFQRLLRECLPHENVLLVGHNPNLTRYLGQLISAGSGAPAGNADTLPDLPERARVRLRKGSMARLSLQRGPATLQWLLDPRTVKALYASSTISSRRKISRK